MRVHTPGPPIPGKGPTAKIPFGRGNPPLSVAAWLVRAPIFLCRRAYYAERHLKGAWRELHFAGEDQATKATRDPVAPVEHSATIARRHRGDRTPIHSFPTLLAEFATTVRNTACPRSEEVCPRPTMPAAQPPERIFRPLR